MSQTTVSRTVVLSNRAGLHLRAAMLIAKTVRQFAAQVSIVKSHQRVEATDMLQIISLGAECGAELGIEATGQDADQVIEALGRLFSDNFGEDQEPGN